MATPTSLPATFVAGNVLTAAQMNDLRGAFRILQVVSTTKTDTFSASTDNDGTPNAQWASVTGLTATITPTAATSKVLVFVSLFGSSENSYGFAFRLTRGGTAIGVADAAGSRNQTSGVVNATVDPGFLGSGSVSYLDSPASTSALTYGVDVANVQSSSATVTVYVNRSLNDSNLASAARTVSTITVMEVSA